jgi:hypothetical protein
MRIRKNFSSGVKPICFCKGIAGLLSGLKVLFSIGWGLHWLKAAFLKLTLFSAEKLAYCTGMIRHKKYVIFQSFV